MRKTTEIVTCDECGISERVPTERLSAIEDIQRVKLVFEMPDINIASIARIKDLCCTCRSNKREQFIKLIGD